MRDPQPNDEWQDAVDLASTCLAIDAARQYGLVTGGSEINVERCAEIVAAGAARGITPSEGHIERCMERIVADQERGGGT